MENCSSIHLRSLKFALSQELLSWSTCPKAEISTMLLLWVEFCLLQFPAPDWNIKFTQVLCLFVRCIFRSTIKQERSEWPLLDTECFCEEMWEFMSTQAVSDWIFSFLLSFSECQVDRWSFRSGRWCLYGNWLLYAALLSLQRDPERDFNGGGERLGLTYGNWWCWTSARSSFFSCLPAEYSVVDSD